MMRFSLDHQVIVPEEEVEYQAESEPEKIGKM